MTRSPTKPVENADTKQRGRPFQRGVSGNPSGKPKGARHRATLAAEALLDGEENGQRIKRVDSCLGERGIAAQQFLRQVFFLTNDLDECALDVVSGHDLGRGLGRDWRHGLGHGAAMINACVGITGFSTRCGLRSARSSSWLCAARTIPQDAGTGS